RLLPGKDAQMSEQTEQIRARARLALRAEKAFGVDALPVRMEAAENEPEPTGAPPVEVAAATPGRSEPVQAARAAIADLFGGTTPVSPQAFAAAALATEEKRRLLAELDTNVVKKCVKCRLCEKRTNTVFGEGDPDARILFIGEGPGENEDLQGRPFV